MRVNSKHPPSGRIQAPRHRIPGPLCSPIFAATAPDIGQNKIRMIGLKSTVKKSDLSHNRHIIYIYHIIFPSFHTEVKSKL